MAGILGGLRAAGSDLGTARGAIEIDTHDMERVSMVVRRVGQDIDRSFRESLTGAQRFTAGIKSLRTELMALGAMGGVLAAIGVGSARQVRDYRAAFKALVHDEAEAVRLMEQLTLQANDFGLEVAEVWQLARALLPILEGGTQELDAWVKRAAMLAEVNPLRTAADASRALQQYLGGQTISLQRIFNIDPRLIREAQDQFADLGDQIDYILDRLGATEEAARGMRNEWVSLKNEIHLSLAVAFEPLFHLLQGGARHLREFVSSLRQGAPEVLLFGSAIAMIAVLGAPTLLFLEHMISSLKTLKALGVLGALGKAGLLGGAALVGGYVGLEIGRGIGRATGDEQMAQTTPQDLWRTIRQAVFIAAYQIMSMVQKVSAALLETERAFRTAVGGMIEAMGRFVQSIGAVLPEVLGGPRLTERGEAWERAGRQMQEDVRFERGITPRVQAEMMRDWMLGLAQLLGLRSSTAAAPTAHAQPGAGAAGTAGIPEEQLAAIENWAQQVQAIEQSAADQRLSITRAYEQQRADIISSYGRTIAREAEDWARQQARAWERLQSDIAAVHQAAAERDAAWQQDFQDRVHQIRSEGQRRIERMYEEHQVNLERLQREHRNRLLEAASRLDARAVAEEQRRYRNQTTDMAQDLQRRVQQERENLEIRIQQEQEAHEKRLAQARAADERRIRDLQESFREQRRLQEEDRQIRLQRMAEDHQLQLAQLDRNHAEQLRALEQHKRRELMTLHGSFVRQMADLGRFTSAWEQLQRIRQEHSLRLFEHFWNEAVRIYENQLRGLQQPRHGIIGGRAGGGAVTSTGAYMLHGTASRPEYVLSADTVASLRAAVGGAFTQRGLIAAVQGVRGGGGITLAEGAVQMPIYAEQGMDVRAIGAEVEWRLVDLFTRLAGRTE